MHGVVFLRGGSRKKPDWFSTLSIREEGMQVHTVA